MPSPPPLPAIALPGHFLGPTSAYTSGPGTYAVDSQIHASIAGRPLVSSPSSNTTSTKPTLSILLSKSTRTILPTVSATVLCRVARTTTKQATVSILAVDAAVCAADCEFQGVIRREDVRATEKDKVSMAESFRAGDVVRGVVISLGDQSNYYISTARNEYGVLMARSEDGNTMYPISWREFRDPETGRTELRKVAKPF